MFNFGAGPAMLPESVLQKIQADLFNWRNTGASVMEISHRSPQFRELLDDVQIKLRQLMKIPNNYKILFTTGGAQGQFSLVPMNLLKFNQNADYFLSGTWSEKAFEQAKKYTNPHIVTQFIDGKIPDKSVWKLNQNAAYVYYCPNETVAGVQFPYIPDTGNIPLVADMTSVILSEELDINKFGLIFASAQKNLGIAGVTLVIVRDDLLDQALDYTPHILHYKTLAESNSLVNTLPVFPIYVMSLVLDWLIYQGGVARIAKINAIKASKLYQYIDNSTLFYNQINRSYRSRMNVTFNLTKPDLLYKFLYEANESGLKHLRGHVSVGGVRASIYNAMPESGINKLIEFMYNFEKSN